MSVHKLTAGSGYDYLTRQVAALDGTEKGHTGLADYYTAKGETPGRWVGSGVAGIDGLSAGDPVTAEQMQALFGSGHHPLAQQRRASLQGPGLTDADYQAVTRLGTPFPVYPNDVSAFRIEVAKRIAAINQAAGLPGDWPVPPTDRARARTEVAVELFRAEYGRDPDGPREVAASIAKHSRPKTTAVAGYDLTFSPVKSVSTLWAIAPTDIAARVEAAHHAAVGDALRFLEQHALFTRTGARGVRQVDVHGMVAAAFTHRDSRAGDPDLHTHVAVANKVQTLDGKWLSIDGRVLFKAAVTASETYNTALERHLHRQLGLAFAERPDTDLNRADRRKRPVREIVGVDPRLAERWSARRASIQERRGELAADFQRTHGRPPTPVESIQLAQQATLETREAKHEPRSLAEQRTAWREQAVQVLGGPQQIRAMVAAAMHPNAAAAAGVNAAWIADAAGRAVAAVEARRSTWQVWHVRAEAHRQVRAADLRPDQIEPVVGLLVDEVLTGRSVSLAHPNDGIVEPESLRRLDGASVYTVSGADQYTSTGVLAAERRLVSTGERVDGYCPQPAAVEVALLETAANGAELNAGQAALVRTLACSGARLQMAIAPAGAGKTTAMRALAAAWIEGGGDVVGLAPSAAAAAVLRAQTEAPTDTLAKLVWSIQHGDLPAWARGIGPRTLVLVDEAGMADTLSLDTAVQFVVARGGSVRLVGDDQQLAAIGAGGVLRDIAATHGAARLTELVRFADPAEAAATLALRDGRPEALGFYLDNGRVHVGDLATLTEDVFDAWQLDRANALDAVMLAPTRELVAELNHRARQHRIADTTGTGVAASVGEAGAAATTAAATVLLADGNEASVGDLVITRANQRTLRISASDWVKNGDRWLVLDVHNEAGNGGRLTVAHAQSGRRVTLPADYVAASVELGYATTVHGAQGMSVDVMHGLATGQESRQQVYTMLTRGRLANHVYLEVVGDGDPHNVIRPDNVAPPTATDLLETVLARDDSAVSASTLLREQADPAALLGQATARYVDALSFAAEAVAGPTRVSAVAVAAQQIVPGIIDAPGWPTLRAHLLLLGASGTDPVDALRRATAVRELDTAGDRAAVLDWRLDDTGLRNAGPGPLPWVPAVPTALAAHTGWGPYLTARAQLMTDLADQVHNAADTGDTPIWARQSSRPTTVLLGDVEVWRAAMQVSPTDRRPTGPPQLPTAAARWQHHLDQQTNGDRTPAMQEWGPLLHSIDPAVRHDEFTPTLADQLAAITRAELDGPALLRRAAAQGQLPDDHAAAALWWRIHRHLSPAVAADLKQTDSAQQTATWLPQLVDVVGADRAQAIQASRWWPTLVTAVDHGLARGWALDGLLGEAAQVTHDMDECLATVWRISILTDPPQSDDPDLFPADIEHADEVPAAAPDRDVSPNVVSDKHRVDVDRGNQPIDVAPPTAPSTQHVTGRPWTPFADEPDLTDDDALAIAAALRDAMGPLEPSDAEVTRQILRAAELDLAPVSGGRMLEINQLALDYFRAQLDTASARGYLADRFGQDVAGHPLMRPGYSPAGWTHLVTHLRRLGVTDLEMTETGVATTASTGRIIDRFRDRAILPIVHNGDVLGFVGRRRPDFTDHDNAGPKYLNTPDTALFHKGAQLFGAVPDLLEMGAVPVLVEGPMDAWAVTLASAGTHVGVAPLGTSLTDEQATQLAGLGMDPIVATDADLPGRVAAERAFWLLAQHRLDPQYAALPDGTDPADLLAHEGPEAVRAALAAARPLGDALIDERLAHLPPAAALPAATAVLAAQPPAHWDPELARITSDPAIGIDAARHALRRAVQTYNRSPHQATAAALADMNRVKERMATADDQQPAQRWAELARRLDPRLVNQGDWPALAAMIQQAHQDGHDVHQLARELVADTPLNDLPAQDLRYRLASHVSPAPEAEPEIGRSAPLDETHHRPPSSQRHDRGVAPPR